ncbi:MAG TPA: DUF397 domain-containing protein [Streptosporangiaceae bacterium]|nr:DUF397 domain-containing protein [Streptosporangiaceae bacterium]
MIVPSTTSSAFTRPRTGSVRRFRERPATRSPEWPAVPTKSPRSGARAATAAATKATVARTDRLVAVRDSKNPAGPVLAFAPTEWHALLTVIKTGIPPTR